jgi:putative transcriptional regulator
MELYGSYSRFFLDFTSSRIPVYHYLTKESNLTHTPFMKNIIIFWQVVRMPYLLNDMPVCIPHYAIVCKAAQQYVYPNHSSIIFHSHLIRFIIAEYSVICNDKIIHILKLRGMYMFDYSPLWATLKRKGITQYQLIHQYEFSTGTLDALRKNKSITVNTLETLCLILDCTPNDILQVTDIQKKSN